MFKGKYKEGDKAEPATWKTRLRCALNKSPDFEEVTDRSQLDISEPYKVYRIVPEEEQKSEFVWARVPMSGTWLFWLVSIKQAFSSSSPLRWQRCPDDHGGHHQWWKSARNGLQPCRPGGADERGEATSHRSSTPLNAHPHVFTCYLAFFLLVTVLPHCSRCRRRTVTSRPAQSTGPTAASAVSQAPLKTHTCCGDVK